MISPPFPAATLLAARDATKAQMRIASAAEDVLMETHAAGALAMAESFIGMSLIAREWTEDLPPQPDWRRICTTPVAAIISVASLVNGNAVPIPLEDCDIDIDADGTAWIKAPTGGSGKTLRIILLAGLAQHWADLPTPVCQGVTLLASHLFNARESEMPPAAVAAFWRPYRRMRLMREARHQ